ncbi:hypothetical protein TVAG_492560 [Trichomonas vaginalis G3]|uniref:COP9 signalosome complex subunit 4 n=1 Tax=Trichomonas vaginalis (strain ATCC PRA-98 / G3) TaxID=412133 RepID=A2F8H2_TRIV3|nr:26S proteasome non-ATPase regulatory subunit 12/COP9 signalosome complex subunit 4 family [Trichomonas vaginalis G3]EAX98765.1 hypothetical protein TVAG_492560 [Trichomonas vaginalis G3]KAI5483881.1 26S proteasome non-ATPase regulatory subunit 12/COP9 signalosome complex subunit 4 family [Trichomonas vaginalis G3]|eukprot:XP_001311695.1 hypothetical protein [Trichomonas vaginalis G3]
MTLNEISQATNPEPEQIDKIIVNFMVGLDDGKLQDLLNETVDLRISNKILLEILKSLFREISKLDETQHPRSYLTSIRSFYESKNIFQELQSQYLIELANAYESVNGYEEAARLREDTEKPEEEFENLEFYEHIAELYLLAKNEEELKKSLMQVNGKIFRLRTPQKYITKFDNMRGRLYVLQHQYQEAYRAFMMVIASSESDEVKNEYKKLAAICACLNIKSKDNKAITALYEDPDVKKYPFYKYIDLISKKQLIDQAARDEFIEATKGFFDVDFKNDLDKACLQHNLKYAEKMFSSVKFERLADLIGFAPIETEQQIKDMIIRQQIHAAIDQELKIVIFDNKISQSQDESIIEYSDLVNSVIKEI